MGLEGGGKGGFGFWVFLLVLVIGIEGFVPVIHRSIVMQALSSFLVRRCDLLPSFLVLARPACSSARHLTVDERQDLRRDAAEDQSLLDLRAAHRGDVRAPDACFGRGRELRACRGAVGSADLDGHRARLAVDGGCALRLLGGRGRGEGVGGDARGVGVWGSLWG